MFECKNGKHPIIKRTFKEKYYNGNISDTDGVLDTKDFDAKLDDFVWKTVSMKLDKYKPFLLNNINLKSTNKHSRRLLLNEV